MKKLLSINTIKQIFGLYFLFLAAYAGFEDLTDGRLINDSKDSMSMKAAKNITRDMNSNAIAYSYRPFYYGLCAIAGALLLFGERRNTNEIKGGAQATGIAIEENPKKS